MTPLDARHWLHLAVFDTLGQTHRAPVDCSFIPPGILRDYQQEIIKRVAAAMALGYRRILVVLPTGGGKTVMAWAMMQAARTQQDRSQFIVHRKELIDQTSETFEGFGLPHGFVAAGRPAPSPDDLVTLAGVQSLVRRLDIVLPPRLAIVDESHHATAASWKTTLDYYSERDCFVVGLTATPERLDGKGLDEHFDLMIVGPTTAELIDAGYLSRFDYYAPGVPDMTGIHTTAGDFNRGEIDDLMNEPKLVGDIVTHYRRLADGEQGIVFAASRAHSRNIVDAFKRDGILAEHVDGETKARKDIVQAHRKGEIAIMSNVELFGEGFDVPAVSYVALARPTKSLSLHLQQCGRALRVADDKNRAVICDHAGNAFRHGLPDEPRDWSLQGRKGRTGGTGVSDDAMPVHQCKVCFRVTPSSVKICPGCETVFPVKVQAPPKQEAGELAKLERVRRAEEKKAERERKRKEKIENRMRRKIEERKCEKYDDFLSLAVDRGYNYPQLWAEKQMSLRARGRPR